MRFPFEAVFFCEKRKRDKTAGNHNCESDKEILNARFLVKNSFQWSFDEVISEHMASLAHIFNGLFFFSRQLLFKRDSFFCVHVALSCETYRIKKALISIVNTFLCMIKQNGSCLPCVWDSTKC